MHFPFCPHFLSASIAMPITCKHPLTPLDRGAFGKLTYAVVAEVLAVRKELGRFFDERIYKQALARRCADLVLEVPIWVSHGCFRKSYFLDALLAGGGIMEFKAVEAIVRRHISQLLHYLMLAELRHGLLVNLRSEQVTRRYVNNLLSHVDRRRFASRQVGWNPAPDGAQRFESILLDLLHDWGTSLDLALYEEALTHLLGGESQVIRPAEVVLDGAELGAQPLRFAAPGTAFKLTAFDEEESREQFVVHARKLVAHTRIEALLWANIGRHDVILQCITP
jgi:GxxExxY protein